MGLLGLRAEGLLGLGAEGLRLRAEGLEFGVSVAFRVSPTARPLKQPSGHGWTGDVGPQLVHLAVKQSGWRV